MAIIYSTLENILIERPHRPCWEFANRIKAAVSDGIKPEELKKVKEGSDSEDEHLQTSIKNIKKIMSTNSSSKDIPWGIDPSLKDCWDIADSSSSGSEDSDDTFSESSDSDEDVVPSELKEREEKAKKRTKKKAKRAAKKAKKDAEKL